MNEPSELKTLKFRHTAYICDIKQCLQWVPNGCHYLPLTINEKRHSKTMRPTAYIFRIYPYLVIPCINLANHAPEVQIGQVLRVICSHKLVLKKHMRPTAQVSSITYKQIILCNQKLCNVLFFHTCCLLFVLLI